MVKSAKCSCQRYSLILSTVISLKSLENDIFVDKSFLHFTWHTLEIEEGKFGMKMHDLGPKIAYLQERPREAPPLVLELAVPRPSPDPSSNFAPFNPNL